MANVPLGQAARATRTVSAGIGPISWGYIDIGFLLCMLTCLVLPWHCTIPVFLSFVNRVSQGWVFCETSREAASPRRGGGGREEGWGPLGRPASCSPAVPLPLRTCLPSAKPGRRKRPHSTLPLSRPYDCDNLPQKPTVERPWLSPSPAKECLLVRFCYYLGGEEFVWSASKLSPQPRVINCYGVAGNLSWPAFAPRGARACDGGGGTMRVSAEPGGAQLAPPNYPIPLAWTHPLFATRSFPSISGAVEDVAYEQGFSVYLCHTDDKPEKEAISLNLLRDEHVAEVICSPTRQPLPTLPLLTSTFLSWSLTALSRSAMSTSWCLITSIPRIASPRISSSMVPNRLRPSVGR